MGTRNLTFVVKDEKIRIAQYGQWDGYPDGQGRTVYEFINTADLDKFRKQVDRIKFAGSEVRGTKALEKRVNELFSKMNTEMNKRKCYSASEIIDDIFGTVEKFEYQCHTRDTCANILEVILNAPGKNKILLVDETKFAGESLFCEWAYLLDLDKNTLEVYRGFNTGPVPKGERFANMPNDASTAGAKEYNSIRLLKTFDITNMPSEFDYITLLDKLGEKDW